MLPASCGSMAEVDMAEVGGGGVVGVGVGSPSRDEGGVVAGQVEGPVGRVGSGSETGVGRPGRAPSPGRSAGEGQKRSCASWMERTRAQAVEMSRSVWRKCPSLQRAAKGGKASQSAWKLASSFARSCG